MTEKLTKGYCILTETLGGDELVWRIITDDGEDYPEIYETELEAQKAIAEEHIDQITEFINDEREYDEVDWTSQNHTAYIEAEGGIIKVWDGLGAIVYG